MYFIKFFPEIAMLKRRQKISYLDILIIGHIEPQVIFEKSQQITSTPNKNLSCRRVFEAQQQDHIITYFAKYLTQVQDIVLR